MNISHIPSEALAKLLCDSCNKYLSFFPIYQETDGRSICGRCRISNSNINIAFQNLAQYQKFPCSNDKHGCTEYLFPEQIPNHEKLCPHQINECPLKSNTSCTWEGKIEDLLDHFEDRHPTSLMKQYRFELDFVNKYHEKSLMPYASDLFILNKATNIKDNEFLCWIESFSDNEITENYKYNLTFTCGNSSIAPHVIESDLPKQIAISTHSLQEILQKPTTIIVEINILQKTEINKLPEYKNEINWNLLQTLECPVCFHYMVPPIIICIEGHSICQDCKSGDECPICRETLEKKRNITLEHTISVLYYPCKNELCNFSGKPQDIREHEKTCIFNPFNCPLHDYKNCRIDCQFPDLYNHIVNNHYENLLEVNTVQLPFIENEDDEDCFIIKYYSNLFKLHYKYNFETVKFYWSMQLIGQSEDCHKFRYEIDICDMSGNNLRIFYKRKVGPLSTKETCFDDISTCVEIPERMVRNLIEDDFSYRVRILKE